MEHITLQQGEFVDTYVADDNYVITNYQSGDEMINYSKNVITKANGTLDGKFHAMLEAEAKAIADQINPKPAPEPEPEPEPSEEEKQAMALQQAKDEMITKINDYDSSSNVNSVIFNGVYFWIDKSTRVGLKNSTNDEIAVGRTETTLILGDTIINISCETLLQILTQLEVYAKDCYNVTAQHKIDVNALTTIDEVNNFDYTAGYPAILNF